MVQRPLRSTRDVRYCFQTSIQQSLFTKLKVKTKIFPKVFVFTGWTSLNLRMFGTAISTAEATWTPQRANILPTHCKAHLFFERKREETLKKKNTFFFGQVWKQTFWNCQKILNLQLPKPFLSVQSQNLLQVPLLTKLCYQQLEGLLLGSTSL